MDKPMTFNEWLGTQGNMVLLHANCCRIAYEAGQQSQQAKVEEQAQEIANLKSLIQGHELRHQQNLSIKQKLTRRSEELQKRVEDLERKLQIKTRHCEFFEKSRKGHRGLAIHRKKQINSALEQIENLYAKAEIDYEKERNPYYDGMLSALDLAEQAVRGELEEQALKGEG
ncbi:hypothetical protein NQ653_07810 [Acinetobacter baumannii]|nr:hypothetical protein [Acinetobacter baumannii]